MSTSGVIEISVVTVARRLIYAAARVGELIYRYRVNDVFTYNGVQFKVVCCDPEELGTPSTYITRSEAPLKSIPKS